MEKYQYQNSAEWKQRQQNAKYFAFGGIAITIILCYLAYYFYSKGKIMIFVSIALLAIVGLYRTFFDINFFSCTPSLIGTINRKACGGLDRPNKTPTSPDIYSKS